jgi:hypothetical protein
LFLRPLNCFAVLLASWWVALTGAHLAQLKLRLLCEAICETISCFAGLFDCSCLCTSGHHGDDHCEADCCTQLLCVSLCELFVGSGMCTSWATRVGTYCVSPFQRDSAAMWIAVRACWWLPPVPLCHQESICETHMCFVTSFWVVWWLLPVSVNHSVALKISGRAVWCSEHAACAHFRPTQSILLCDSLSETLSYFVDLLAGCLVADCGEG